MGKPLKYYSQWPDVAIILALNCICAGVGSPLLSTIVIINP